LSAAGSKRGSLRESVVIQWRVVRALMLREVITRYGRENIGVLWLIAEPMMFTLGVATLWYFMGAHKISAMPIIAFAITGYSSVLVWRNSANRCTAGIQQNVNLLYHRNVRVLDVFVTRIALEIGGATGSFIILACIFTASEWISPPVDMIKVLTGWLLLCWFGAALGILMGAASSYSEIIERFWHTISYLMFPLSGAGFMVDWFPAAAQSMILLLPMVNGVELLRDGYFGNTVRTHYDIAYTCFVNLALTLVGLMVLRDAGRRVGQR
jgi:capsular polysaccharide transport system permease protein